MSDKSNTTQTHNETGTISANSNSFVSDDWHVFTSINDVVEQLSKDELTTLFDSGCPFTSLAFLSALERHHCVSPQELDTDPEQTGWQPHFYLHRPIQSKSKDEPSQVGLFICYLKSHSYGEYVFDWSWAEAYHRHGIHYYPKLISTIPFTPVPTSKWLGNSPLTESQAWQCVTSHAQSLGVTGAHLLFPKSPLNLASLQGSQELAQGTQNSPVNNDSNEAGDGSVQETDEETGTDSPLIKGGKQPTSIERQGNQFHWFNQSQDTGKAYQNFDEYLSCLTARKRKMIKKERAKVIDAGIRCIWKKGNEVTAQEREIFYQYYHNTYYKRGRQGYLTFGFFNEIFDTLSEQLRLLVCYHDEQMIAGALYFLQKLSDKTVLCGRYWGSNHGYDLVHFEACYYQGIEFAITHSIDVFNPGTQGEHKIPRGFKPTLTYSYHNLYMSPFHEAIADFCTRERQHNQIYMQQCEARLPYKNKNQD